MAEFTTSLRGGRGVAHSHTPVMNLQVQYEGEWIKFDTLMKYMGGGKFNRGIKRDIAKAQRDFLTRMRKNLIAGLASGGSAIRANWPEHASGYQGGLSMGVKDGYYLLALFNSRIVSKGYIVSLRLSKGDLSYKPKEGGLSVGRYALIFEKGSKRGQPPRPLWSTAFEFTGGRKQVLGNMTGAIKKRLSKMGIHIKTKKSKYVK